jgi:hypothetical protein
MELDSYVEEKLRLAGAKLKGSPNRRKLEHVVLRTLIAVQEADLPVPLQAHYSAAREVVLRHGKLGSDAFSQLTDEEVGQVWRALKEVCRSV